MENTLEFVTYNKKTSVFFVVQNHEKNILFQYNIYKRNKYPDKRRRGNGVLFM